MIVRDLAPLLGRAAATMPVVTLTGPRQSGKTALCRALFPGHAYRTLEEPDARAFALDDPRGFLRELPGGALIDEIQRAPNLLSYLQALVDDDPAPGRWILVGSQNRLLLESISQSLAGRTELHELLPLAWGEIRRFAHSPAGLDEALLTGGHPRIFHHSLDPTAFLREYMGTYLERDVRSILDVGDLATFQRFVGLCASRAGKTLNYSSLANDSGITPPTAKRWVDVLETSFIVFRLPAFDGDIRKQLVKTPKLYFCDSGLLCWLLGIHEPRQLRSHPLRGAIFETWVVSEALKNRANLGLGQRGLTFYRDRNGVEADLVIENPRGRTLVGTSSAGAPSSDMLRAVRRVRGHLRDHLPESPPSDPVVVYGGDERQRWTDGELIPWRMARAASLRDGAGVVQVLSGGRPITAARILVVSPNHPNERWKSARTDAHGEAILDLTARDLPPSLPLTLPLTLFVAAPGFEARLEREWFPAERAIAVDLARLPGGGGVIFPQGSGDIPGLAGRLTVVGGGLLAAFAAARMRSERIAVNGEVPGELQRPVYIRPGEELHLEDAEGSERWVRVLEILGRSVLVEYRREQLGHPRGQGEKVGRSG
ncbi:ATP-binding protein [Candidatus Palauibacter sp.]|uniref:ATP-binding protein n=1 Tax=Candidatus Palauibacter sp. TaxID=3101350 RepID=UPI003D11A1BB